ncbi:MULTISPECIES: enoyl-CoA hydratase/isomerase family protein [Nonomuraea]|uniref:Enoyl-CoA hydratase-related protein n=1 Tax=Nonomuraea ferruginea TaxID=46174 RepID=A0ABT4T0V8_9ACTN|nr:enoyl-CoA hydratase-related protein [Nonomuraea ferruginea]MDA0643161.1 enoyl-CoA hydratase-related protein [Nonomuraea ferruginea]
MSDNPVVLVERDGSGIVTVTLDRPDTKNSVPRAGWIELAEVFGDIAGRADDRVVVLTGAGGDFCSGSDLRGGDSADSPRRAMRIVNAALLAVRDLPQPTIAAVSGVAAGGGFNLALACDLAVAEETARFSQIFARRGLSVDFGGTWFLTHMLGLHRAKELAFFGRMLPAADVHALGLLNKVVPEGEALAQAYEWARELLALAPLALSQTKEMLNLAASGSFHDSVLREAAAQNINGTTEDTREAIRAFLEKRDPVFRNR